MIATQVLCIPVPLRVHSEANGSHGHWSVKAARVKHQRHTVAWCLRPHAKPDLPAVITMVRIAPRKLDAHDNLPRSFKACVDQVAEWLGVKDNDPRIKWQYAQRSEGPGKYACEIVIESELEV
jgi:hypothetical protein